MREGEWSEGRRIRWIKKEKDNEEAISETNGEDEKEKK